MIDVSVQITGSGNTLSMQARSSLPYYRPDDVSTEEFRQITEIYFRENLIVETGQKLCKIRITGVAPDPDNDEKNTLTTGVFVCESEVTSADDVTLRSTLFAELGSDEWYTFVDFSFPA